MAYTTLHFKDSLPIGALNQLIYIEDEYHATLNHLLQDNYDALQSKLESFDIELCYLPRQAHLLAQEESVRYYAPYLQEDLSQLIDSTSLNAYIREGEKPLTGLMIYTDGYDDEPNAYGFRVFTLSGEENDFYGQFTCVVEMLRAKREQDEKDGVRYCITEEFHGLDDWANKENENAPATLHDDGLSPDVRRLINDIHSKIDQLRELGVNEMILQRLLRPQVKLSHLRITSQNRIFLPDYGNREIKMSPLVKAVFFLFLHHPEGIAFKMLPDYRTELSSIYSHLTGRLDKHSVQQSIADVTDPYSNSINEKCARIREAFVREFDDSIARYYYITGERGTAKRIILSQELIVWDSRA